MGFALGEYRHAAILYRTFSFKSIRNTTNNKLDQNERNINTLLFGNDQVHLETNKKIFAIVHVFLRQADRL